MTVRGNITLITLVVIFVSCATAAYCNTRDAFALMLGGLP